METATLPTQREASSHITQMLVQRLSSVEIGKTVSFKELDEAVHADTQSRKDARYNLCRALKILENSEVAFFESIRDVGYKRLSENEILRRSGVKARTKITGVTNKWRSQLSGVDPRKLQSQDDLNNLIWENLRCQRQIELNDGNSVENLRIMAAAESVAKTVSADSIKQSLLNARQKLMSV